MELLRDSLDERDTIAAVEVLKADVLIHLHRYQEASAAALGAVEAMSNTRSLLMLFKALLHEQGERAAVRALIDKHQQQQQNQPSLSTKPTTSTYTQKEDLARLILCTFVAQDCTELSVAQRDRATQCLLRQWMGQYAEAQLWQQNDLSTADEDPEGVGDEHKESEDDTHTHTMSYLEAVCNYMHLYLHHNMSYTPDTHPNRESNVQELFLSDTLPVVDNSVVCSSSSPVNVPVVAPVVPSDNVDFFTLLGYPDSVEGAQGSVTARTLSFTCTLAEVRQEILAVLEETVQLITCVEKAGLPAHTVGTTNDLKWLAHLAYNTATVLLKLRVTDKSEEGGQRWLLAARLFELSEHLVGVLCSVAAGTVQDSFDRASCFLIAAACRVDAEATAEHGLDGSNNADLFAPSSHSHLTGNATTIPSSNLVQARLDAQKADRLLQLQSDFDDPRANEMRCQALILEFSALCRFPDSKMCQSFVKDKQGDFLRLSIPQLQKCANTAKNARNVSVEVTRSLLNLALQRSMRDTSPDYALMGSVYRELIELSPSRRAALDKLEEFHQLATTVGHTAAASGRDNSINAVESPPSLAGFLPDDIDHIVSLAYNYGVALVDLDQMALAEKFLSRAISLLGFASAAVKGWLPKIQVPLFHPYIVLTITLSTSCTPLF